MVEAAAKIAAFGRARIAVGSLVDIAGDDPAVFMEAADEVDRLGVAHRGSLFEPAERRRLVFIDTLAEPEQGRVIVHAPIEPHLGGHAKAGGRALLHPRGAPAEVVAADTKCVVWGKGGSGRVE